MLWTRKQSNKSFRGLIPCMTFAIRRALCFACVSALLLLCFFPAASRADATNQQLLDALNAINQNIYAIYSEGLWSIPWTDDPNASGELLWNAMAPWFMSLAYDLHGTPSSTQGAASSGSVRYLLQAIANKPGSVWTTNDIVRLLAAVNAARSPWSSNDVASVRSDVSDLLTWFNSDLQGWSDSNHNPALSVKDYDLVNLFDFVYKTYDMEGDPSLRVHDQGVYDVLSSIQSAVGNDIENQLRAIIEAIEESGADISGNLHDGFGAMSNVVNLARVEDSLRIIVPSVTNSEEYARLIHEVDLGYDEGSSRSVQHDLRFLQQQIGVEYPTASNSIAGILGRLFYSPEDAVHLDNASNDLARGVASGIVATNVMASSEKDVASVLRTNELDWAANEYSSTSPYSEIANLGSSAGSQFANALPDLPDATDRTLVLFRGNFPIFGGPQSRSRAGSSVPASTVNLDVSYSLADYDAVSGGLSTMNGIMSTIWDVIGVILIAWMYKRFYDDVSSGRFEGSMG